MTIQERTPLPDGVSSTLALVESAAALEAYRRQADMYRLQAQRESIRLDVNLGRAPKTPGVGTSDVVHEFIFGEEAALTAARRLTLRANGTGTEIYTRTQEFKWRVEGHELVLSYDVPDTLTLEPSAVLMLGINRTEIQVKTSVVFPSARITLLGPDNNTLRLASWTREAVLTDLEGANFGRLRQVSGGDFMRQLAGSLMAMNPTDFSAGARFAGPLNAPIDASGTGMAQDVLKLTSATEAVFERTGETVQWRLSEGRLRIQFPGATMLYGRIGIGPQGEARWLGEQLNAEGKVEKVFEVGVVQPNAVSTAGLDWVGKWLSDIGANFGEPFIFTLRSDAKADSTPLIRDGQVTPAFRSYWRWTSGGRVEIATARFFGCVVFDPRFWSAESTCELRDTRSWTPVARNETTIWVFQNRQSQFLQSVNPKTWRLIALRKLPES